MVHAECCPEQEWLEVKDLKPYTYLIFQLLKGNKYLFTRVLMPTIDEYLTAV
jgi:hypothetical protein